MNKIFAGFLGWAIPSVIVLGAILFLPFDAHLSLFYPKNGWAVFAAACYWIAIPSSLAAGLSFVLATFPKPRILTCVWTIGSTFVILIGLFTVWLYVLNLLDSNLTGRFPGVVFVLLPFGFLLPGLSFLGLPLIVESPSGNVICGPWWRAFFMIVFLQITFAGLTLITGEPLARPVADLAVWLGFHYYTWLNAFDVWIISAIATAGAAQAGLCWAKEHNSLSNITH